MKSDLPLNWRYESLGKCCYVISGATPRRDVSEYWGGGIPWVTPKDISKLDGPIIENTLEYISEKGYKSCSATILPEGSVLFSSRAPIGLVALTGRPMCTNQGFKSLVPKEGLNSKYLYHCMKWVAPKLKALGNGATFKEVSKEVVSRFEIPFPPLSEQKRIAAILDKADAIRRKRQQAIKLAGYFSRATFFKFFGDPVTNANKWENLKIGKAVEADIILEIQDGNHGEKHPKVADFVKHGLPFLTANAINKDFIDFNNCNYLDPIWLKKLRVGFAKPRDVILTHKGSIGLSIVLDDTYDTYICSPQTTYYRVNEKKLVPEYLYSYFLTPYFQNLLISSGKQSTRLYVGITRQKDLPILIPPIEKQKKYFDILLYQKKMIKNYNETLLKADVMFNSLAQKYFSR